MTTPSRDDAHDLLDQLDQDGSRLAASSATPWWAPFLLGLVAAFWVATPVMPSRTTGYVLALVGAALVVHLVRSHTGIRVSAGGARSVTLAVLWLASMLGLYSVSLALVSLDRAPWVVLPALVAGALTAFLVAVADRWAREGLAS